MYNGSSWVNEGLLIESEARTNLLLNSVPLIGTNWSLEGSPTFQSSAETDPTGNTDAQSVVATQVARSGLRTGVNGGVVSGTVYTISVIAKDIGQGALQILGGFTGFNFAFQNFDLANGTLGSGDGTSTGQIEGLGNGWYRCSLTATATGSATDQIFIIAVPSPTSTGNTSATIGDGFLIWAAQAEAAPTPSSYIPTSGATVTRAAESVVLDAADMPFSATGYSLRQTYRQPYWDVSGCRTATRVLTTGGVNSGSFLLQNRAGYLTEANCTSAIDGFKASNVSQDGPNYSLASRMSSSEIQLAANGTSDSTPATITSGVGEAVSDVRPLFAEFGTLNYPMTAKQVVAWANDIGTTGIEEATQ